MNPCEDSSSEYVLSEDSTSSKNENILAGKLYFVLNKNQPKIFM